MSDETQMFAIDPGLDITHYIPHRDPMVLIDRLVSIDESQAIAQVEIRPQSQFYNEQLAAVPGWVGIEYMAQTVAAFAGYHGRRNESNPMHKGRAGTVHGHEPRIGFLLGARKYQSAAMFELGQNLTVHAQLLMLQDGFGAFACAIDNQGTTISTARLNVYEPESIESFDPKAHT